MKNLLFLFLLTFILASCGIRKSTETRRNAATGERVYSVWVFDGLKVVECFQTPIDGITQKKIDSVHKLADNLVKMLKSHR